MKAKLKNLNKRKIAKLNHKLTFSSFPIFGKPVLTPHFKHDSNHDHHESGVAQGSSK